MTLKRLGNISPGNKQNTRVIASKLIKRKPPTTTTTRAAPPANDSAPGLRKVVVKAEVKPAPAQTSRGVMPKRRGKRKRQTSDPEPKPVEKRMRKTTKPPQNVAKEDDQDDEPSSSPPPPSPPVQAKSRFDPDVMEKLFDFGAKIDEVLTLNTKTMDRLVRANKRTSPVSKSIREKLERADVGIVDCLISWVDEETRRRNEHREAVMETLREKHNTCMTLYSNMLTVLKSVTANA